MVDSLDKHIQNEKEIILASAGMGGGLCLCGDLANELYKEYINLALDFDFDFIIIFLFTILLKYFHITKLKATIYSFKYRLYLQGGV